MAKPAHTRVTLSGIFGPLGTPYEVWNCNLSAPPNLGAANDGSNFGPMATSIATAWTTHIRPVMATDLYLTRVRVAAVTDQGLVQKTAVGGYVQSDWTGSSQGQVAVATGMRKPLQSALVASLHTARAGATGKGRIFWPSPLYNIGTDFRITAADAAAFNTVVRAFLNAVKTALGTDLVVASSKGYLSPVTGVSVGQVIDTQRSRRHALPEGKLVVAL
jgi:hypothetical protein